MKFSHGILLRRVALQIALSLLAIAVTLHGGSAVANPRVELGASMTVRHADLDLSRPGAAGILYQRIQSAARRVCNASVTYLYLETAPARQECYRQTVAHAVASTNLPELTAVHAEDETGAGEAADDAPVRTISEVMSQRPLIEIENSLRAWAVEKSTDFGVVLVEVLGTIPLHMHPDGNRRMFLLEGRVKMLGGDHDMGMAPGDYMYLPRSHHHKVWLDPGSERALLLLVDSPPTSARNVVWLDSEPEVRGNPDQAKSALEVGEGYESGE